MTTRRKLILGYVIVACLTLLFQIWWRSGQCAGDCAVSFAKAVVWSIVWPLSWIVFLKGL
jgi:hypothetical protein